MLSVVTTVSCRASKECMQAGCKVPENGVLVMNHALCEAIRALFLAIHHECQPQRYATDDLHGRQARSSASSYSMS